MRLKHTVTHFFKQVERLRKVRDQDESVAARCLDVLQQVEQDCAQRTTHSRVLDTRIEIPKSGKPRGVDPDPSVTFHLPAHRVIEH